MSQSRQVAATVRVLLVGASESGKTALLKKMADNNFSGDYNPTQGMRFQSKQIQNETKSSCNADG